MSGKLNRHDLLEKYGDALGEGHLAENAPHDLFEAIAAAQKHLGTLVSLYKEVTGQDITRSVIAALRMTIDEADRQ